MDGDKLLELALEYSKLSNMLGEFIRKTQAFQTEIDDTIYELEGKGFQINNKYKAAYDILDSTRYRTCDILGRIALYIPAEALFSSARLDGKDVLEELEFIINQIGYCNTLYADNTAFDTRLYSKYNYLPIYLNLLVDKLKCLTPIDPELISTLEHDERLGKLKFGDVYVDGIALTTVPFFGRYELSGNDIRDIGKMTIEEFLKTGGLT